MRPTRSDALRALLLALAVIASVVMALARAGDAAWAASAATGDGAGHSPSASSGATSLGETGWTVRIGGAVRANRALGYLWKEDASLPAGSHEVVYDRTFEWNGTPSDPPLVLVFPTSFFPYDVSVNGAIVAADAAEGPARIFARRTVEVPAPLLRPTNTITLRLVGEKPFLGFRDSRFEIREGRAAHLGETLTNVLMNDAHILFACVCAIVGLLCFFIRHPDRVEVLKYRALGVASVAIVPHHLLATDVYRTLGLTGVTPFKINLAAQVVAWPGFLLFFLLLSPLTRARVAKALARRRVGVAIAVAGFAFLCTVPFLPFHHFVLAVYPVLGAFALVACVVALQVRRLRAFGILFNAGSVLILTSLVSDVFSLNVYLLGYGSTIFSACGLLLLVSHMGMAFLEQSAFGTVVGKLLPRSVHERLSGAIAKGADLDVNLQGARGGGHVSVILVDICDWSILSDARLSRIPRPLLDRARTVFFTRVAEVLAPYGIELSNTSGDNARFLCGLYDEGADLQRRIANATLRGIDTLLDSIAPINAELASSSLPRVQIKISASLGHAVYGLELISGKMQFDLIGDEVNIAYRIETGIDQSVYKKFGRNVALVSENVISACDDTGVMKRFMKNHTIQSKHGQQYFCYVGQEIREEHTLEEFNQVFFGMVHAMVGVGVPESAGARDPEADAGTKGVGLGSVPAGMGPPSAAVAPLPSPPAEARLAAPKARGAATGAYPENARAARRRKIYHSDRMDVRVDAGRGILEGRAMDLTPFGMAVSLPADVDLLGVAPGTTVVVAFSVAGQPLQREARVTNLREARRAEGPYVRVGLSFEKETRNAADRSSRRFFIPMDLRPHAYCRDPLNKKRMVLMSIVDVSATGMAAFVSADESAFLTGLEVTIEALLPGVGLRTFTGRIRNVVFLKEAKKLRVGFLIHEPEREFQEAMGRFLLHVLGTDVTLFDLKDAGFRMFGLSEVLRFSYVEGPEDFDDILDLRLRAWKEKGQFRDVDDPSLMRDGFDEHSRHLLFRCGGAVVAAGRIVFNDGDRSRVEHLSYGAKLPSWLLEGRFVEASRVVTDPQFRGDEVFLGLLEEMGRVAGRSGHRFILQSCAPDLFPVYARFGFEKVGEYVTTGTEGGAEAWFLTVMDLEKILRGEVPLLGWSLVCSTLRDDLKETPALAHDASAAEGLRVSVLDAVKPIVRSLYKKRRKARA